MCGYSSQLVEDIKTAKEADEYYSNNFIIITSEF
jgi:hypothetical protein